MDKQSQDGFPELYSTPQQLEQALMAAKRALPPIQESVYKPSGESTLAAKSAMLLATPVILLLILGSCVLVLVLLAGGEELLDPRALEDRGARRVLGGVALIVDLGIALVIGFVPGYLYVQIGRLSRNRNAAWPMALAGMSSFIMAAILFWPIWSGQTLAPTGVKLLGIPLKWPLILIGGLAMPLASLMVAHDMVGKQKFCEISGVFLKAMDRLRIPLAAAAEVVSLLSTGHYSQLLKTPPPTKADKKQKNFAELVLWWHENAQTGYLELTAFFKGQTSGKGTKTEKSENWLVLSKRCDHSEAMELHFWLGG